MKNIKILGAAAIAAAALMAWAGTASATTVTSSEGATPVITAVSTNSKLHGSYITTECSQSHFKFAVEQHGSGITAAGKVSSWFFTGCNYPITVIYTGSLAVHATGGGNGTLTWTGGEFLMHTSVGECRFTTSATDIGTVTGGSNANLDIGSASVPRTGGSFFCGSSLQWTGNYTFQTPSNLTLD